MAQVATILTWTPITRHPVVVQAGARGMEEARAARSIPPHIQYQYLRRFRRMRRQTGLCNLLPHPLHLLRLLSRLRRSTHIDVAPHFLTCLAFVIGSSLHSRLIYSLLPLESQGSYPHSMRMKRSTWTNTGTLIGSLCGGRSSANSSKSRTNKKKRASIRSGSGSCYGS